ncbi:MAG: ATP-grasp fold amidoligase family protein [Candidatus Saccharibacteria bacterium]|nr:ATP-grasp fold amidoligase family protein [Candidatus Saccharibacteria bacterium]
MRKISNFLFDKKIRFGYLSRLGLLNWMSDEKYLKKEYKLNFATNLDIRNPKTFNEKLQWLKLNDRKDIYTMMADKYEAKKYVADIVGEKYIVPTIGVYNKFDEINFDELPNQFVIKCTHDSGGIIICKDKTNLNKKAARKKINKFLKRKYYYIHREWPYKNIKPRIIIEEYLDPRGQGDIRDYKFFCCNGKPKFVLVCSERFSGCGLKETWFDLEWNLLPVVEGGHGVDSNIEKPLNFNKMKNIATTLSKGIPFLRVDFYEIDSRLFFGELTFYPCAGYEQFDPKDWNYKFGREIEIPIEKHNVLTGDNSISVVVPTYNSIGYIDNLIASVENQTYDKYELIFIDDGSNDGTYEYLKEYASSKTNTYVYKQKHAGPGAARKLGYEKSHGDLLFFVDSDDWLYTPKSLEEINKIFLENNVDICISPRREFPSEKRLMPFSGKMIRPGVYDLNVFNGRRIRGNMGAKIFRKKRFNSEMFVDSSNFEDMLTTYRYLDDCTNILYTNNIFQTSNRMTGNNSLTTAKDYMEKTLSERAVGIVETYRKIKSAQLKVSLADLALMTYCDFVTRKMVGIKYDKILSDLKNIICVEDLSSFYPLYSARKKAVLWCIKHENRTVK